MPWGGARPGAGRPEGSRKENTKGTQLAARVTPWLADWVKSQPEGITATITEALMLLREAEWAKEQGKKEFRKRF